MNHYTPAEDFDNDSLAYTFCNLTYCWIHTADKMVEVIYQNRQVSVRKTFYYGSLRQLHPHYPEALEVLLKKNSQGSVGLCYDINVMTSHFLGACLNLQSSGITSDERFFCDMTHIESGVTDDDFYLNGFVYTVEAHRDTDILIPTISDLQILHVDSRSIDMMWPGGAKKVITMEALGFSSSDIMTALLEGNITVSNDVSLDEIRIVD